MMYFLQGQGATSDAIFQEEGDKMKVVAEVSYTAYYDTIMSKAEARKLWQKFKTDGWVQVSKGRRTAKQILELRLIRFKSELNKGK